MINLEIKLLIIEDSIIVSNYIIGLTNLFLVGFKYFLQ